MGDNRIVPLRDSGIQIMPTPRDVSAVNPYCCRMKRDHKVKVCTTERDFFMPPMDPWRIRSVPCYWCCPLNINLYFIPQPFPACMTPIANPQLSYSPLPMQTKNPIVWNKEDIGKRVLSAEKYNGTYGKEVSSGDFKKHLIKRKLSDVESHAEKGIPNIVNNSPKWPLSKIKIMSDSRINYNAQRNESQLSNQFSNEAFPDSGYQTGNKRSSVKSTEKELNQQWRDANVGGTQGSKIKRKSKSIVDKNENKEFTKWKKMSDSESYSVAFQNSVKPVLSVTYSEKTNRSSIHETDANSHIFSQSSCCREGDRETPYIICSDMSDRNLFRTDRLACSDYKPNQRPLKYHDYHVKINDNSNDRISKGKSVHQ